MKKKYFALMAISVLVSALMYNNGFAAGVDCNNVAYPGEFQECLNNSLDITLGDDIVDAPTLVYNQPGKSVTINMNGHDISALDVLSIEDVFAIIGGTVTFAGEGVIGEAGGIAVPIRIVGSENPADVAYTTVNIGPKVGLISSEDYGIVIGHEERGHSYATFLNFEGKILARRGIYVMDHLNDTENYPNISIADGAIVTAVDGPAIEASGYAGWNIGAAKLFGDDGIGIKQGRFYIDGAEVVADGVNNPDPQVRDDDMFSTGAAIQIMTLFGKTDRSEVYIKSGSFKSKHGYVIVEYAGNAASEDISLGKFRVYTGEFEGTSEFENSVATTSTGAFVWYFGDGQMLEDGSMFMETADNWDSHKMTIARYAKSVSGFDKIYASEKFEGVERIVPVYTSYDGLIEDEVEAISEAGYGNAKVLSVFDITPRVFMEDFGEPEPGMSKIYSIATNTGEEYPITFEMFLPESPELEEGYEREYYVLNLHMDLRTGEYDIEKIPARVDNGEELFTFSTHKFSTFALVYEDVKSDVPDVPNAGYGSQESLSVTYRADSMIIVIILGVCSTIIAVAWLVVKKML